MLTPVGIPALERQHAVGDQIAVGGVHVDRELGSVGFDDVRKDEQPTLIIGFNIRQSRKLIRPDEIDILPYVIDQYLALARTTRITLRYVLKRRIGQGGMGEVWLGEHNLLARPAAIKLIRDDAVDKKSPEKAALVLRRFEREAQADLPQVFAPLRNS